MVKFLRTAVNWFQCIQKARARLVRVVVVGNQSRYKSRPLNTTKVSIAGVYDLLLNLLKEISYVSTRSVQIANANLSMSEALYASSMTNIAIFF